MEKIAILYLIDVFIEMGGAERNLLEIVTHLDKKKYRPIVWCLQGGKLLEDLAEKGLEVRNLKIRKIYGFKAVKEAIKLIKFIKKEKIKIVVTYHEGSDFWGGIIAKLAGVPVVISSRRDMGFKLKKRHILLYKRVNNWLFDQIITVSDAVKKTLIQGQNVLPEKVMTIYNGVDSEIYKKNFPVREIKTRLGLNPDNPVVGILAYLNPIKGHNYFLAAAAITLKVMPETQFLVAGWQSDTNYFFALKKIAENLGISRNVFFIDGGFNVEEMLAIMDISVISSLSEGFSNTILESMASGKPVVATTVGGNPELVVDGETGFLVPPEDAERLGKAVVTLLKDKILAKEMGIAGRKRVENSFNFENMINKIDELFDSLLKKKILGKEVKTSAIKEPLKILISRFLKSFSSGVLYYSGAICLFRNFFVRTFFKNSLKILAYHRISDDLPDYLSLSITVSTFEKQIKYLKKHYYILSLGEAVNLVNTNKRIPRGAVVITFDDGYRDNYTNAFPILKKYNVPATIFLTVNPINSGKSLWFEIIITMIKETQKELVDLTGFGLEKCKIKTLENKKKAILEIIKYGKTLNENKKQKLIEYLSKELDVDLNDAKYKGQMLSWEEILEMKKSGVSFGAHTMSHPILTTLPIEEAEYEILESKKIIEQKLGEKINLFAYPNGGKGDFNQDIIEIFKNNGFSGACTLIAGENNTDVFALKRKCVTDGLSKGIFGVFSKPLFAAEMAGFFDLLRRGYNKI